MALPVMRGIGVLDAWYLHEFVGLETVNLPTNRPLMGVGSPAVYGGEDVTHHLDAARSRI